MDGDERHASQRALYSGPVSTEQPSAQSIDSRSSYLPYTGHHQPPRATDVDRASTVQSYRPNYGDQMLQSHHLQGQPMSSVNPVHSVHLQSSYGQDPSRMYMYSGPHQQYPTYPTGPIFPPAQQQMMYDATPPQAQQRRSIATEILSSEYQIPSYMQQDLSSGLDYGGSTTQYFQTQPEQAPYPSASIPRNHGQPSFAVPSSSYSTSARHQREPQQERVETLFDQEAANEGVRQFRQELRPIFSAISGGKLIEASSRLQFMSQQLSISVFPWRLHYDDEVVQQERLAMWQDFNHCWEALGQKQKDITEQAIRSGHEPSDMLSADRITALIDRLILFCDQLSPHGLVDYEMGVWEEQIVSIFITCLDLLQGYKNDGRAETDSRDPMRS